MNMISNEQRDSALVKASDLQKYLYSDPQSGKRLREIANKHSLGEGAQYKPFVRLVGDVILGLINRAELPELLKNELGIELEQALKINGDVLDFLENKPDQVPPQPSEKVVPIAPDDVTYSNTQDALLQESKKTHQPRWETE